MILNKNDIQYDASSIEVLKGLEPVRKRPGMYIGGLDMKGYHHLLWEVIDNSVDEVLADHADEINIYLDEDCKGVTVIDNGRGIPVDKHPVHKKPALELILCTLHAGGKFGNKSYPIAGGLHGVGVSVVNALSEELIAHIWKDHLYSQTYSRGIPANKINKGESTRRHGTSIYFRPDQEIFGDKLEFNPDTIKEHLEIKAYLHKNLKITFHHKNKETVFQHPNGIVDYISKLTNKPIHTQPFHLETERLELTLQWTEDTKENILSFANGIPTHSGGTHENGFKLSLSKAIRSYMDLKQIKPKGVTITPEDIREGLVSIISVYLSDPQFQGQTKDRLNNPEISSFISSTFQPVFEQWLLDNPTITDSIIARIIIAARARTASRAAAKEVKRKSATSRLTLPGKLSDCSSSNPEECELFIVEGDSAGGNAKQGRDRRTQAVLPLRGKVLNTEHINLIDLLKNKEIKSIIDALGTGIGKDFNLSDLRYHKIFLLMDADSDGHHITTLLLTFFYRHLPELIRNGHVYISLPPLYRIDVGKSTFWALDDSEKNKVLRSGKKHTITRFKGLGEMSASELKETTLDVSKRRSLRVFVDGEVETDRVINELMGKDASLRYQFIMENSNRAVNEDLDV